MFNRISSLDGIRGVSILLVIFGHVHMSFENSSVWSNRFFYIIGNHQLGVTIFFVLSGFLITKLLLDELKNNEKINLKVFYLKRFFRILPTFFVYILALLALKGLGKLDVGGVDVTTSLGFIWNYNTWTSNWWLAHTWSLSLEEQFYIFWPAMILLLGIKGSQRAAVLLVILSPLIRLATFFFIPDQSGMISSMTHTRLDALMAGCVLSLFWENEKARSRLNLLVSHKGFLLIPFYLFIISPFLAKKYFGLYMIPVGYSVEALFIGLLIYKSVCFPDNNFTRFLNNKFIVQIGLISYSLYIWQQLFLGKSTLIYSPLIGVALAFVTAYLSYYLIEKPLSKTRNKILTKFNS